MKKILIILLSVCLVLFPAVLNASEIESLNLEEVLKSEGIAPSFDKYKESEKQTTIYFFRTAGDSNSISFLNYLNSIYNDYGEFFKVKTYEVGANSENKKLMDNTIDYLNSDVTSTPFIIIGDVHFISYDEGVNENIIKAIVMDYESEEKVDIIDEVLLRYYRNYDLYIGIILILVIGLIGAFVYASLKGSKE